MQYEKKPPVIDINISIKKLKNNAHTSTHINIKSRFLIIYSIWIFPEIALSAIVNRSIR